MYCIYLIQHSVTKQIYIGLTNDLKRRLYEHNASQQKATKRKIGEWVLVYAEAYRNKTDAQIRERKLKQHGSNKRWLKDRIKYSLFED
ncbi:MAG: GIY-YIG nuclease family protein [Parcubacteria group bacterium]|nr:GIY-YIG nuclease family protein [Parcubacteria group bacterium]